MAQYNKKTYLGDAVYAIYDGYQVELQTDHQDGHIVSIYLDDNVLSALLDFRSSFEEKKNDIVRFVDNPL